MSNQFKSPTEQRALFEKRGIKFTAGNEQKDLEKITGIGYYKLKEFAYPYAYSEHGQLVYKNLAFKDLLTRYYQDKNLRVFILHALEEIEVYLNNQLAFVLSTNKMGAFGYLEFKNWADRSEKLVLNPHTKYSNKFTRFEMEKRQFIFKSELLKKIKYSHLQDVRSRDNQNEDGFPNVWAMVDCLTFGDTVNLITMMNPRNKRIISRRFDCSVDELISWVHCLNMVRNTCVHNSDLIDMRLHIKPLVPEEYAYLLFTEEEDGKVVYTNRLALIIMIVKKLMDSANPKYSFTNISNSLGNIIKWDVTVAHELGFRDAFSHKQILSN